MNLIPLIENGSLMTRNEVQERALARLFENPARLAATLRAMYDQVEDTLDALIGDGVPVPAFEERFDNIQKNTKNWGLEELLRELETDPGPLSNEEDIKKLVGYYNGLSRLYRDMCVLGIKMADNGDEFSLNLLFEMRMAALLHYYQGEHTESIRPQIELIQRLIDEVGGYIEDRPAWRRAMRKAYNTQVPSNN